MASFPCRSASVRPACPLTNVSHHSSAEQDEYAGLWVMPLRLLNADFRFWSRFRGGFFAESGPRVEHNDYDGAGNAIQGVELHMPKMFGTMVFEDWPIGI